MPILPAEPDIYPPTLLDGDPALLLDGKPASLLDGAPASPTWWALYTLARREKELMRRLRALEVPFYAPLVSQRTRSPAGRTRQSYLPLFPGYVFLCGDELARQSALTTNCVSRTLSVPDSAGLVRDLKQIKRMIASDAALTPEARIEVGRRVRVRSGSMLGLEGTVVRRRGKDWLLVVVEFLQQGVSVLLEDFQVEAI